MVLDEQFRKLMKETIESELEAIGKYPKDPASKTFWEYDSQFDFEYGWHIGYIEAVFFTAYLQMRKKVPDRNDELEIKKTIALHSREIKKLLSKRKTLG
ncbi:MAG: hypothetical protein HYR87_06350 [Thaumarchaeota archaeon]|nr:hypothetical protein [Nitrososphaerota archaeon]